MWEASPCAWVLKGGFRVPAHRPESGLWGSVNEQEASGTVDALSHRLRVLGVSGLWEPLKEARLPECSHSTVDSASGGK